MNITIANLSTNNAKTYVKYIENIEKIVNEDNKFVSEKALKFLDIANKLHNREITLDEYKKNNDIVYEDEDENIKFKIGCLNYIKNSIAKYYPN